MQSLSEARGMGDDRGAMRRAVIVVLTGLSLLALAACGGGGDGGDGGSTGGGGSGHQNQGNNPTFTPGVFLPSAQFAQRCQVPRRGNNPWTGKPWPDQQGSALLEKYFLRSWTNEYYLWADEVLDLNPFNPGGNDGGVLEYFDLLKTTRTDSSGKPKDRYHYAYDTEGYWQLAFSGTQVGYGISWAIVRGSVPRDIRVEYVQAGSGPARKNVRRGARLVVFDDYDVVNGSLPLEAQLDLFYPLENSLHKFVFQDVLDSDYYMDFFMTAEPVVFDAVPRRFVYEVDGRKVGYLLLNNHNALAEPQLRQAVDYLASEEVEELVLDLRYNGGGFLDVAAELAYMIAGPAATAGRTFERRVFNSKHTGGFDPISGEPLATPFHSTTQGLHPQTPAGLPLPSLDLSRVFVLTSERTCSASESVINGLRGIGVEVIQIGGTTCGKPYGFYPRDNCGTTYFSIQFGGVNEVGFGEYADGFSATRTTGNPLANLPGCAAEDDLTQELGVPLEGQLKVALHYIEHGSCPPATAAATAAAEARKVRPHGADLSPAESDVLRRPPPRPWENNRIYR
jgi:carboxyl-terminal processing protease